MIDVKSVPSKETTRIPKPKLCVKETKSFSTKASINRPPEDKKFTIRRTSKTGILEKSNAHTKLGEYEIKEYFRFYIIFVDVANHPGSASSFGERVPNFGRVPAYLKRDNSVKRDSDAADKVKSFNALKTSLRAAQSQFFKALGTVNKTRPDGLQEEYRFIALIKNGEGKLIIDDSKDVPKINGGSENKFFLTVKEKLSLMTTDVNMLLATISEQFRTLQEHPSDGELFDIRKDFSEIQKKIESISAANVSGFVSQFVVCPHVNPSGKFQL